MAKKQTYENYPEWEREYQRKLDEVAERVLDAKQAAEFLNTTVGCLNVYRATGKGPRFHKLSENFGGHVFYTKKDLIYYKTHIRRKNGKKIVAKIV